MFSLIGQLVQIITFPGVIVHELAHQLFCRWCRVAVFEVVYFRIDPPNPSGYVVHEAPRRHYQTVLISIGPFIVNTVLGLLIGLPAALQYKFDSANLFDYLLMYLGVSIAMHAFPSTGDAAVLWNSVVRSGNSSWITRVLVTPIVGLIYAGALGSIFWLDLLYGVGVAVGLPYLLIKGVA